MRKPVGLLTWQPQKTSGDRLTPTNRGRYTEIVEDRLMIYSAPWTGGHRRMEDHPPCGQRLDPGAASTTRTAAPLRH